MGAPLTNEETATLLRIDTGSVDSRSATLTVRHTPSGPRKAHTGFEARRPW
jgi:hypothetical protein